MRPRSDIARIQVQALDNNTRVERLAATKEYPEFLWASRKRLNVHSLEFRNCKRLGLWEFPDMEEVCAAPWNGAKSWQSLQRHLFEAGHDISQFGSLEPQDTMTGRNQFSNQVSAELFNTRACKA